VVVEEQEVPDGMVLDDAGGEEGHGGLIQRKFE
jgi:hypothetical protein